MSIEPGSRKPLRLWPGIAVAVLLVLFQLLAPVVRPDDPMLGLLGAVAGGALIGVWWLLFSRTPWIERVAVIALMAGAVFVTRRFVHPSIANAGMGIMLPMFSIPVLGVALVAAAVASRGRGTAIRGASIVAGILVGCGSFTLIRTGGVTGDGVSDLHWRWTKTHEELLLAQSRNEPFELSQPKPVDSPASPQPQSAPAATVPVLAAANPAEKTRVPHESPSPAAASGAAPATMPASEDGIDLKPPAAATITDRRGEASLVRKTRFEWPGFRGPNRDSTIPGVRINTEWSKVPPSEMWRRPIGPGWSSFAVHGDVLYTQEQRGEEEIVGAYNITTGAPVWRHSDQVRFWESNGGAGPRATPTPSNGRLYTLGATGVLNALDAASGAVIWSRNLAADAHKQVPGWGFASSPLVIDDLVIVAATGTLVAYDAATGMPRWFGPPRRGGYSSPHLARFDGVAQILLLTADGALSVSPADGKLLWEHAWAGVPIVQPALLSDHDLLMSTGDTMGGNGLRRVAVTHRPDGWTTEERWTSTGLKPYFNDYVVHNGHAFGFDSSILACIDLADGTRKWKGGRYGHGQVILLADQDLLLVLSEEGELALVAATPEKFTEIARFPVLEGKTWNHPVLAGNVLLVRNDHEMAAFRLTLTER